MKIKCENDARLSWIFCAILLQKYDAVSFKLNNNLENGLHIASLYNRPKFIKKYLDYESFLIEDSAKSISGLNTPSSIVGSVQDFFKCDCCKLDLNTYINLIRVKDNKSYTPFLTAISNSNQKCVEEMIENKYIELSTTDNNGNSIYHISIQNDNFETLKYLFDKLNPNNYLNFYNIKNNINETLLHAACRKGNQEIANLIMNKLHETNRVYDDLLFCKNKDGQNCFHVAASKGYFNIIEYFLRVN